MRIRRLWVAIVAAIATGPWFAAGWSGSTGASAQTTLVPRSLALTFDDLPYVYVGEPQLSKARRATGELLRVLASHRAPAVAFVNAVRVDAGGGSSAGIALLQQWVDGGIVLGNHTYSHADFNTTTVEEFEADIVKGEAITRRLMRSREPYPLFFRHPHTHTGNTREKKEAIERFLEARAYRVVPHTIDSSDFIFNVGFVRAMDGNDRAAADRLGAAYVAFVIGAVEFAERVTPQVFGRDIPQTVLLHANDINGHYLDGLLRLLERRGYRFVTLEEAMADPAYQTKDTFVTTFGPTWLWRWMKSRGMAVSFRADPEPPDWVLDLYNRGTR
jgi:peptidoglycan/xylan/chitin deacetylase (PgdA/CDA1 family)